MHKTRTLFQPASCEIKAPENIFWMWLFGKAKLTLLLLRDSLKLHLLGSVESQAGVNSPASSTWQAVAKAAGMGWNQHRATPRLALVS